MDAATQYSRDNSGAVTPHTDVNFTMLNSQRLVEASKSFGSATFTFESLRFMIICQIVMPLFWVLFKTSPFESSLPRNASLRQATPKTNLSHVITTTQKVQVKLRSALRDDSIELQTAMAFKPHDMTDSDLYIAYRASLWRISTHVYEHFDKRHCQFPLKAHVLQDTNVDTVVIDELYADFIAAELCDIPRNLD